MRLHSRKCFAASMVVVMCLGNAFVATGQKRPDQKSLMVRLEGNKPTVYITFKGTVSIAAGNGLNEQHLQLELHNNTRWTLLCYLVPGPTSPGDSAVMYQVDTADGSRAIYHPTGDVLIPKTFSAGTSVSFLVSSAHLAKGYRIYVEFNYEWEKRNQIAPYPVEPSHRVYFYHNDLPADLR